MGTVNYREKSGLPAKFSDDECYAYCWLKDCGITGWVVDLLDKSVTFITDTASVRFPGLLSAKEYFRVT